MLTNSNINKIAVSWKYSVAVLAITSGFQKSRVFEQISLDKLEDDPMMNPQVVLIKMNVKME
jgi:hypothetical protein